MKKTLFIVGAFSLFIHVVLSGQEINRSAPKAWIDLTSNRTISAVYLYQVRDSSIAISNVLTTQEPIDFNVNHVESISIKNGENVLPGLAIGMRVGAVIGGIVGLASLPKCDKDDGWCELGNALVGQYVIAYYSAGFGLGGGLVGGVLGANAALRIPINGSYEKYHKQKEKLRQYSVLK